MNRVYNFHCCFEYSGHLCHGLNCFYTLTSFFVNLFANFMNISMKYFIQVLRGLSTTQKRFKISQFVIKV